MVTNSDRGSHQSESGVVTAGDPQQTVQQTDLQKRDFPPIFQEIWEASYRELELQMPRETFQTWAMNAWLYDCQDNHYTIVLESKYGCGWFETRLHIPLERILKMIAQEKLEKPVTVSTSYVTAENLLEQALAK